MLFLQFALSCFLQLFFVLFLFFNICICCLFLYFLVVGFLVGFVYSLWLYLFFVSCFHLFVFILCCFIGFWLTFLVIFHAALFVVRIVFAFASSISFVVFFVLPIYFVVSASSVIFWLSCINAFNSFPEHFCYISLKMLMYFWHLIDLCTCIVWYPLVFFFWMEGWTFYVRIVF